MYYAKLQASLPVPFHFKASYLCEKGEIMCLLMDVGEKNFLSVLLNLCFASLWHINNAYYFYIMHTMNKVLAFSEMYSEMWNRHRNKKKKRKVSMGFIYCRLWRTP